MDYTTTEFSKINGFTITHIGNNLLYGGKYLSINTERLEEAKKVIIEEQIDYIEIDSKFKEKDLSFLKEIPSIKGIKFNTGISGKACRLSNFEGLSLINNLELIVCADNNPYFPTDLTIFKNLKKFSGYWNQKQVFNAKIERIYLENLKSNNLLIFSSLSNLIELHLSYSNFETLYGIRFLKKLNVLKLYSCNTITTLSDLEFLNKTITTLSICRCRKLNDYRALEHLTKICDLHIADSGNLTTLNFVKEYDNLESAFIYVNVDDEDGTPLKNVKYISIPKKSNLKNISSTVFSSVGA